MIRKSIYTLAAIATVAAASFASLSPAEARHGHGGRGYGFGFGGIVVGAPVVTSCVQYQWVETRRGWVQVAVNVC